MHNYSKPPKFLTFRICLGILCLYALASYFDSAHASELETQNSSNLSEPKIELPTDFGYYDYEYDSEVTPATDMQNSIIQGNILYVPFVIPPAYIDPTYA